MNNINLKQLNTAERLEAKAQAKKSLQAALGQEPTQAAYEQAKPRLPNFDDYLANIKDEYPQWFSRLVLGLLMLVFVALAYPSLVRLISIGSSSFGEYVYNETLQMLAGISTFLTAEFMLIVATIAFRSIARGIYLKSALVLTMIGALALALVGNYSIVQPNTLFTWLEAALPPMGTGVMGLILEGILMRKIEARADATKQYTADYNAANDEMSAMLASEQNAYRDAVNLYRDKFHNPENHDTWRMAYATALREMIIACNSKGRGKSERIEYLNALDGEAWRLIVIDEMNRENWLNYQGPVTQDTTQDTMQAETPVMMGKPILELAHAANGNGNENHANAAYVNGNENKQVRKKCTVCQTSFVTRQVHIDTCKNCR